MTPKPIIAIDGPAASGKSTTARLVARRLGYLYIDTGAMYRAMGLKALRNGIPFCDIEGIAALAAGTEISQRQTPDGGVITFLDGQDVSREIRQPEISQAASDVSTIKAVRQRLVALQQRMGRDGGVVMEGRDIGSVVFPGARVKLFMQASIQERAKRRRAELLDKGIQSELTQVESEIALRDRQDSGRDHSPLVRCPDAIIIDTTGLSIDQQVNAVLGEVQKALDGGRAATGTK